MAFEDGDSSGFTLPTFGDINTILQGPLGRGLLDIGTTFAKGYFESQNQVGFPLQTSAAAMPAIIRGGAMVASSFALRFPNLAAAIAGFAARGITITRSKLWSLVKRFGPDFIVAGGILSASAISELFIAGPGRRRMNAGNVKALRRAHRRMKAFHNVCTTNDRLLGGRKKGKKSVGTSGQYITQVK